MKPLLSALTTIMLGFLFTACTTPRPTTTTTTTPQLVIAAQSPYNNDLNIWTSTNGTAWNSPITVDSANIVLKTIAAPSIVNDGFLYHLLWIDPNGNIRYATSRNLLQWNIQSDPLVHFSPNIDPEHFRLAQGAGKFLAMIWENDQATIHIMSNTATRSIIPQVRHASIIFGNGKFLVAKTNTAGAIEIQESIDGVRWSVVNRNILRGNTARISFSDGRFFLAITNTGVRSDTAVPNIGVTYFESRNNGSTWSQIGNTDVSNDIHYLSNVFFQFKNMIFIRTTLVAAITVSENFAEWRDLGPTIGGRFSAISGPIPPPR